MNFKGTLPMLILQVLQACPKHGYRIAQEIRSTSDGALDFKEGALYPALHGLEKKAWVESFEEVEKGRRRRYYRLTDEGLVVLNKERQEWATMASAVNLILGVA